MKTAAPALLPVLRSNAQGEMLALLFLNPEDEFSLTDISRITGSSLTTIHAEAARLVTAGVARDRRVGNIRLLTADTNTPLAAPLLALLMATYGPPTVLGHELASVPGIELAYLHGEWAERHAGHLGPVPEGLELLVVGAAPQGDLDHAVTQASQVLLRPIHASQVTPDEWAAAGKAETPAGWLAEVASGSLVPVDLARGARSRLPTAGPPASSVRQEVPAASAAPTPDAESPTEGVRDQSPTPTSAATTESHAARCPLLTHLPVIGGRLPQWELPHVPTPDVPGVVTRIAGEVVHVATFRWLPWDSLPIHVHLGPCTPGSAEH